MTEVKQPKCYSTIEARRNTLLSELRVLRNNGAGMLHIPELIEVPKIKDVYGDHTTTPLYDDLMFLRERGLVVRTKEPTYDANGVKVGRSAWVFGAEEVLAAPPPPPPAAPIPVTLLTTAPGKLQLDFSKLAQEGVVRVANDLYNVEIKI